MWTGTADELIATITRWYESGWIIAEGLQDALEMASIHFRGPDGMPVIVPGIPSAKPAESGPFGRFRPLDENYQVIEFDGKQYNLTPYESAIIRLLDKARRQRRSDVGIKEIQAALGIKSGKMSDWFRKNRAVKKIILHTGRQHYRLDP